MQEKKQIKRALLSVSDKTGLDVLGRKLQDCGVHIISSGGTKKYLEDRQIKCQAVEEVTGNPEAFGGRMKTISFQIGSALLYRRDNEQDQKEANDLGIDAIDLVVCNLYPFEDVAKRDHEWDELIENIDIGGPTMIRAAAKNHNAVCVCTNPNQYDALIEQLNDNAGQTDLKTRQSFALEAFRHTAKYDGVIANQIEKEMADEFVTPVLSADNATLLRYGENPHQKAWVYTDPLKTGLASTNTLQGKEMSYNNLLDADAAWRCLGDITQTCHDDMPYAVVVVKHLNPCGAACSDDLETALELAWAGDKTSSFGSILCFNAEVDETCATWLKGKFVEVIIAPSFSVEARELFSKKKNLRLIEQSVYDGNETSPVIRSISGGWLVQEEDNGRDTELKRVTQTIFADDNFSVADFGTMICKHLKSNAIALVQKIEGKQNSMALVGAGMGNPNRLVSIKQAVEKSSENDYADLSKAVLISDAFFPFADNIDLAKKAGITHIVQPGGSIKDSEVIASCDELGISMVFTGRRHFRH